jgi:hypothetical protein
MCQEKETRYFKATKPKTVYKLVARAHSTQPPYTILFAVFERTRYAPIGELNDLVDLQKGFGLYQPGYHCFQSLEDVKIFKDSYNTTGPTTIVKCTIPIGAIYRYGTYYLTTFTEGYKKLSLKTLRASNIIIDKVID